MRTIPALPLWALTTSLAVALAAGLGGCDTETPGGGGGPLVVEGVDLTALFAPPSPGEVAAVAAGWEAPVRTISEVETLDRGGRETVTVLRATAASGASVLAAVRQPPRDPGDQRLRALLLFLADEPDIDLAAVLADLPVRERLRGEFVVVVVAPRGGRLRIDGRTFASSGTAGPYDPSAAEDVLAVVAAVRERAETFRIDPERVAFAGHGTGGHTATLAAARTAADDYLLVLAAPTSFVLPSIRDAAQRYLQGGPADDVPGLADLFYETVGRVRDGGLTLAQARRRLIERSPALFVQPQVTPPAYLFAAYGGRDQQVPERQGAALDPLIRAYRGVFLSIPDAGHTSILQDDQVLSTGGAFLCVEVLVGLPLCS